MLKLGEELLELLFKPIDMYCERVDSSFFAEPLGLFSNLAFMPTALAILYLAKQAPTPTKRTRLAVLALMAFLIGAGSGLFHSIPNALTMAADVIPISCFALVFMLFYFSFLKEERVKIQKPLLISVAIICLPGFLVWTAGLSSYLAGGEFYLGLGPAMLYLSYTDYATQRRKILCAGGLLFFIAYAARTLDLPLCPSFPFGTHFLWHIVNSGVVFLLAYALSFSPAPRP